MTTKQLADLHFKHGISWDDLAAIEETELSRGIGNIRSGYDNAVNQNYQGEKGEDHDA